MDTKQWDEWADLFTDDLDTWFEDTSNSTHGRDEFVGSVRAILADAVTIHHGHHPEIDLTSETTARGSWALYNYMFNEKQKRSVRIGSYYEDAYVKLAGHWKFQHIGYTYLFHEEWSRDDTPSLRLVAP